MFIGSYSERHSMKDSQIIKILRTFTDQEMRSFGKFVNSPYYNTSEATSKLFTALRGFYPAFNDINLTKQNLFKMVYGRRTYNNLLINKLSSNLIKLSLEYIAESNNSLKKYALLRGLRKKKAGQYF